MITPPMKTSANGRHFIEAWEGLYLHTYNDGVGVPTIGYGHTTAAGPPHVYWGMVITQPEADSILAADLASVEVAVNHYTNHQLDQNQFDAMVSFHFNTGAYPRSNVLRAINLGRLDLVTPDLMMWVHGGGHVMQGLVRRRHAESVLFHTGQIIGP